MATELLMHSIQPAVNIASVATLGAATYAVNLVLDYFLLPDNTSAEAQATQDKKIFDKLPQPPDDSSSKPSTPKPPDDSSSKSSTPNPSPGASSSGSSVPPPALSDKIDLKRYNLDISNYTRKDLKADRSFIRAFYYIRNNRDATNEELQEFVKTNLVDKIAKLERNDWRRVYNVMHFVAKPNEQPYVAFFHIKEALSKLLYGGFTVKELLDVEKYSDSFLTFLGTSEESLKKLREVIGSVLKKNPSFYKRQPLEQVEVIKRYISKTDKTSLPLFESLLTKIQDKDTLMASLEKSLQEECDNLNVGTSSDSYPENNKRYNQFIQSLMLPSSPEVSFSDRCGVGDVLASFTNPVICVTYISAGEKQYNFGCKDRFQLNPDNYIIYKHKNHHCELLIPKTKSKAPDKTVPVTPSASVGPAAKKEDSCKKYEDEYFLKGGTRKRSGRKDIPKKSRRKEKGKRRV